ncbi:MAG TPA: hypothetical protein VGH96_12800 [Streptosporangiaceae bacterium]|jgi:hypothetical protein
MDLEPYVAMLRQEFAVAAESQGDDARAIAERLAAPLESSARLALLEALSAAADEITRDLAPGSVYVRLRGRDPNFVVTPPPAEPFTEPAQSPPASVALPAVPGGDDGVMARINFRLAEHLKGRIEQAAERSGVSVNSWLVRAAAAALEPDDLGAARPLRAGRGSQHYTGWVR